MTQYPFHLRGETVVGHAVGFVENGNRDFVEAYFVGLHEVNEAKWCGNDELNTFFEFFNLLVARGTAVHRKHFHVAGFGNGLKNFGNLQCKFTSRNQHKTMRKTRCSIFGNACESGNTEGKSFTATRTSAAADIVAFHGNRNGLGLNGEWCSKAGGGKTGIDIGWHTESGKCGGRRNWCRHVSSGYLSHAVKGLQSLTSAVTKVKS